MYIHVNERCRRILVHVVHLYNMPLHVHVYTCMSSCTPYKGQHIYRVSYRTFCWRGELVWNSEINIKHTFLGGVWGHAPPEFFLLITAPEIESGR